MKAKNMYMIRSRHPAWCKKCCFRHRIKQLGEIYVVTTDPAKSVDGKNAYEMIWVCHNGHLKSIGWTRPVDFAKQ